MQKHLKSLDAGELVSIDTQIAEKRAAINQAAARRDEIARGFKKLDAAVESSAAGEADDKETPSEKIKGRLDDARKLLKGAIGVSALFSELDIVEERLKRIDEALVLLGGTVPEGNDPTEAQRKVAVAFAGMFEILDKLATLEKTDKTMPRTDLVIVRGELAAR